MPLWHITISAQGRQPFFPTETDRRRAVRILVRVAGEVLVHFSLVDEHIHEVVLGSREEAGRLAQATSHALGSVAAVRMQPAHIVAVEGRAHMVNLRDYLLRQPAKHGLPGHPALWTGSDFGDLVGARVIEGLNLRLAEVLPRFRLQEACDAVGLAGLPCPLPLADIRALGAFRLAAAASAARAAPPELAGNGAPTVAARVAAVQLASVVGIPSTEIAAALRVTLRCVQSLRQREDAGQLVRAIRVRLGLEELVERADGRAWNEPARARRDAPDERTHGSANQSRRSFAQDE